MNRSAQLLQGLREDLGRRLSTIERSVRAKSVSIVPGEDGEFFIRVAWGEGAEEKVWSKHFSKELVLGTRDVTSALSLRVLKPTCLYVRDVIGDVLRERGVL